MLSVSPSWSCCCIGSLQPLHSFIRNRDHHTSTVYTRAWRPCRALRSAPIFSTAAEALKRTRITPLEFGTAVKVVYCVVVCLPWHFAAWWWWSMHHHLTRERPPHNRKRVHKCASDDMCCVASRARHDWKVSRVQLLYNVTFCKWLRLKWSASKARPFTLLVCVRPKFFSSKRLQVKFHWNYCVATVPRANVAVVVVSTLSVCLRLCETSAQYGQRTRQQPNRCSRCVYVISAQRRSGSSRHNNVLTCTTQRLTHTHTSADACAVMGHSTLYTGNLSARSFCS